jgi:hypothetical protein
MWETRLDGDIFYCDRCHAGYNEILKGQIRLGSCYSLDAYSSSVNYRACCLLCYGLSGLHSASSRDSAEMQR